MADEQKSAETAEKKDAAAEHDTEKAAVDAKKPTIAIKVYSPFKIFYEGQGYSISAVNETGPFDILPKHHNFLCMLLPCDLVIRTPYETKTVKISRALMHVKADKVTVFVDV